MGRFVVSLEPRVQFTSRANTVWSNNSVYCPSPFDRSFPIWFHHASLNLPSSYDLPFPPSHFFDDLNDAQRATLYHLYPLSPFHLERYELATSPFPNTMPFLSFKQSMRAGFLQTRKFFFGSSSSSPTDKINSFSPFYYIIIIIIFSDRCGLPCDHHPRCCRRCI